MTDPISNNITWHEGNVPRSERENRLGQRGVTAWFTGLSGSGKSTVAVELERLLTQAGRLVYRLDGDNLRHGLNGDLGFSEADRAENIRRTGEVCRLMADVGVLVLASFVSPFRADRDLVRRAHEVAGIPFLEIHVDCALEEAERRDPKGLYRKARAGEIKSFTGIDQPYEAPESPELVIHTDQADVAACAAQVEAALAARGLLSAG
ncbi:MAG: adenylyl-sulfate kinase [Phycisphaerales bacterium]|nr:adenylyl-sulfate kinase [Phycisphaerales bacterium]